MEEVARERHSNKNDKNSVKQEFESRNSTKVKRYVCAYVATNIVVFALGSFLSLPFSSLALIGCALLSRYSISLPATPKDQPYIEQFPFAGKSFKPPPLLPHWTSTLSSANEMVIEGCTSCIAASSPKNCLFAASPSSD
jgi:hypothetical protein